jgi:cytochrome c-type biogenesis protein CcmF
MLPIGLFLLLLTGVGPLLAWRKSTITNLRDQFMIPVGLALVDGRRLVALGVRVWTSGHVLRLSAFVVGTISQEFWRGARVRQGVSGTDVFTALVGLVSRNRRRYGGYIIHIGIVLIFLGFAGEGFKQEEQVQLKPGQQAKVGQFVVRLDKLSVTDDGQKQMITGHTTVFRDGKELGKLYPAKWFFRKHESEPTTEVAIRRAFTEDLYLVMPAYSVQDQSASMEITINPLVNWVWFGFGLLAIGTGIALLPEAAYSFAVARCQAGAATSSLLLLALFSGRRWPRRSRARWCSPRSAARCIESSKARSCAPAGASRRWAVARCGPTAAITTTSR